MQKWPLGWLHHHVNTFNRKNVDTDNLKETPLFAILQLCNVHRREFCERKVGDCLILLYLIKHWCFAFKFCYSLTSLLCCFPNQIMVSLTETVHLTVGGGWADILLILFEVEIYIRKSTVGEFFLFSWYTTCTEGQVCRYKVNSKFSHFRKYPAWWKSWIHEWKRLIFLFVWDYNALSQGFLLTCNSVVALGLQQLTANKKSSTRIFYCRRVLNRTFNRVTCHKEPH